MTIKLSPEIGTYFCYAPWTNIHINPEGDFKTCCAGGNTIGKLKTTPIQDIFNNKTLLEIKQAIYNNQYHENCQGCVKVEQHSSSSERTWYSSITENKTIDLQRINDNQLQSLDIRWSNTCNLSCVYCDHYQSSQWAMLKRQPIERLDYENTLDGILEFIESNKKSLKNISLLGGEPLLQKENAHLLDVVADDVSIYVITNLSVPLETNKIFKKLIQKSNVTWDISFETVENRYEYVRHGSSWDLILKNIRLLKELTKDMPGQAVAVTSQYSVYNAINLSQVYQSFLDYDLPMMRWSELHYPEILSVINLPQKFINMAIRELEICIQKQYVSPFLEQMRDTLQQVNSNTSNCDDLYQWHKEQETKYWPDFKHKFENLWPEYKE